MTYENRKANVSLKARCDLIRDFPCFSTLTQSQCQELASLMQEIYLKPNDKIVSENELIDSIYIIVQGEAEVTRTTQHKRKTVITPVAALGAGEGIGMNDTGFYSTTGQRTATVIAITDMLLLRLDLADLYAFLKNNNLEMAMNAASLQMLRMRFIKQSLPFSKVSHERLQWLADKVEEVHVAAGDIIFKQGEQGDKCYLIRNGQIEIFIEDEKEKERHLALLKPPVLFGEATLITRAPRNATARALVDCDLLVLSHAHLSELIESESNVANMFMTLMIDRSRPLQNPNVTVHQRTSADGSELTILKNPANGSYFKLSDEGFFIWQQLDGQHTLQEITLDLAEKFNVFAPDVVAGIISKLTKAEFISNLEMQNEKPATDNPLWAKIMIGIRRILETKVAFGDMDQWLTKIYNKYVSYLFTIPGQLFLALFAIAGIYAFISNTTHILDFFSIKHASLLLILGLFPLAVVEVLLHELGHAFTVKSFGREVHYIGFGWYWFSPIAFTDTSDMWLATRKPRMWVNFAGIYVDILLAGTAALSLMIVKNPYLQGMLWLFALYTYIGAFRMLSPLQEMDGYYLLMDFVEKNRLRQASVVWLVKIFPQALHNPVLFKQYWPEVTYWLACIIYLIAISALTILLQRWVFDILDLHSNPYISLLLPFCIVLFSCFSIIADVRSQVESD